MLFWSLNNKCDVAWVSPVYNQANKVFEQVVKAFAGGSGVITKKDSQKLKITFGNGSTLQFFSAERYDNIRGFTFDYLVCDEFAFMDEQAWTEVLRATVLVKGKKVLLISTPKGKNHFYKLHSLDGINEQYKSFTMTSYDNPMINPKEIDDARLTLPEMIFRQEYLAEFVDGGHALFPNIIVENAQQTSNCYAGIDVGRANDYTVLTIFNDEGKMFYCQRWREMEWATIVGKVNEVLLQYKPITQIEVNSVGDAVYEMLINVNNGACDIQPFTTTSKSKQDIIEQLIVASQNKEITILDDENVKKEFEMFTYEYSPRTRTIKYSAPSGLHDDIVMSSAIGYNCYKSFKRGKYNWI